MKQILWLLPFLFSLNCSDTSTSSNEDNVIKGDVFLTTQAEVNSFSGTSIMGSLVISGADIVDLTPLAELEYMGGDLGITDNPLLTNLDGLTNITSLDSMIYQVVYIFIELKQVSFNRLGR